MSDPNPSVIQITVKTPAGVTTDITRYVLFSSARFESAANALPGTFEFTVKDVNRELEFVVGSEVYLVIDGVKLYGGLLLQVNFTFAFPVVNTHVIADVTARQIELSGVDFNIWFDKRVIRDTTDYLRGINLSSPTNTLWDGNVIRNSLPNYLDVPPGVDMDTHVDNVYLRDFSHTKSKQLALRAQGDSWRLQMEAFANRGAVYYIDPDKNLHYHSLESVLSPWAFVDYRPNGVTSVGVRDVNARMDGSQIATDALVWGGLEQLANGKDPDPSGTFFARYPHGAIDDQIEQEAVNARNLYGRWQYAEVNFQRGDDQISVNHRAKTIIAGGPGVAGGQPGGLSTPVWDIELSWFAHEVPFVNDHSSTRRHIRAGYIANILLYVMGHDSHHPLINLLPLRSATITFPAIPSSDGTPLTYVRFTGQFGIAQSDPRYLWKYLLTRKPKRPALQAGSVDDTSTSSQFGAYGTFIPTGATNGLNTLFEIPFPYIRASTRVFINGLRQRLGIEYREHPEDGTINFYTPPHAGDSVFIECRTADG